MSGLRPLDDRAVDGHVRGDRVLGISLLEDETCWLLAPTSLARVEEDAPRSQAQAAAARFERG
jgi:hypothetical protein